MIILAQDNDAIYDFANLVMLAIEGTDIVLMSADGHLYTCGKYKTEERCKQIIEEFFTLLGCQEKFEMPVI